MSALIDIKKFECDGFEYTLYVAIDEDTEDEKDFCIFRDGSDAQVATMEPTKEIPSDERLRQLVRRGY